MKRRTRRRPAETRSDEDTKLTALRSCHVIATNEQTTFPVTQRPGFHEEELLYIQFWIDASHIGELRRKKRFGNPILLYLTTQDTPFPSAM